MGRVLLRELPPNYFASFITTTRLSLLVASTLPVARKRSSRVRNYAARPRVQPTLSKNRDWGLKIMTLMDHFE
jgi:hypothetical protein